MNRPGKITLLLAGVLLCLQAGRAQEQTDTLPKNFEGTLEFEYRTLIIDQQLRREMEAQFEVVAQSANSEKNQQAMQKLQQAMADPAMKAHFEANPEMKSQMDRQLQTLRQQQQGAASALDHAFASRLTVQLLDSSALAKIWGQSLAPGRSEQLATLRLGAEKKTFQLDREQKTFWEIPLPVDSAELAGTISRVRGDTLLLGFPCQKFEFEIVRDGEKYASGYMWVTDALQQLSSLWAAIPEMGFFSQINGFPVHFQLQKEAEAGQKAYVFTLKEVKREQPASRDFQVPKSYTQKEKG